MFSLSLMILWLCIGNRFGLYNSFVLWMVCGWVAWMLNSVSFYVLSIYVLAIDNKFTFRDFSFGHHRLGSCCIHSIQSIALKCSFFNQISFYFWCFWKQMKWNRRENKNYQSYFGKTEKQNNNRNDWRKRLENFY